MNLSSGFWGGDELQHPQLVALGLFSLTCSSGGFWIMWGLGFTYWLLEKLMWECRCCSESEKLVFSNCFQGKALNGVTLNPGTDLSFLKSVLSFSVDKTDWEQEMLQHSGITILGIFWWFDDLFSLHWGTLGSFFAVFLSFGPSKYLLSPMQSLKLWLPYVRASASPFTRQDRSGGSQKVHPNAEKIYIKVLKSTRVF